MFLKARKSDCKAKILLCGFPGSGKTYTALTLATTLAEGKKIAFIDTENGTSKLYSKEFDFDVLTLEKYSPIKFIEAIRHAAESPDYGAVVIDSFSHAWAGEGGVLDVAQGRFTGWKTAGDLQDRLITEIKKAPIHTIATVRLKEKFEQRAVNGKQEVVSLGIVPVQRGGVEYEFDWIGSLDRDTHEMSLVKTRCSALDGKTYAPHSDSFAHDVLTFLKDVDEDIETGAETKTASVK